MLLSCLVHVHCMSLSAIGQGMPVFKWFIMVNRWSLSATFCVWQAGLFPFCWSESVGVGILSIRMMTSFYAHVPLCPRYLVLWTIAEAIWSWIIGCIRTVEFTATLKLVWDVTFTVFLFQVFPHPRLFLNEVSFMVRFLCGHELAACLKTIDVSVTPVLYFSLAHLKL